VVFEPRQRPGLAQAYERWVSRLGAADC
jgi:hypothetical protein